MSGQHHTFLSATLLALLLAPVAHAADDQAERLAELRTEVERLSSEVREAQEVHRAELRSLELQKTEMQNRIRQEEVRLDQLQRLADKQRQTIEAESKAGEVLLPVLTQAMTDLEAQIQAGLPYHTDERLAEVGKLRTQLDEGTLSPQKASSRLWQLVEDELRLARESQLNHQVIDLEGEQVLADVARVGMIAMYFRTPDGRAGTVTGTPGAYTWTTYGDSTSVTQVNHLFDSLDKQIRVGFFELPNLVPQGS